MPPTVCSKLSASRCISALRAAAAVCAAVSRSCASRSAFSTALSLNASTAPAMSPISSLRPSPGSTTSKSPSASSHRAGHRRIGLPIRKIESTAVPKHQHGRDRADQERGVLGGRRLLRRRQHLCCIAFFACSTMALAPVSSSAASGAIVVEAICRAWRSACRPWPAPRRSPSARTPRRLRSPAARS